MNGDYGGSLVGDLLFQTENRDESKKALIVLILQ